MRRTTVVNKALSEVTFENVARVKFTDQKILDQWNDYITELDLPRKVDSIALWRMKDK